MDMKDTTGHILTIGGAMTFGLGSQLDAIVKGLLPCIVFSAVGGAIGFFVNYLLKKYFK